MKIQLCLIIASVASIASAQLPNGTFRGTGKMTTKLGIGTSYNSELIIADNVLTANYEYLGKKYAYKAKAIFNKSGFLTLNDGRKQIGSGYCMENLCHFDITSEKAEESLTFLGDTVYRIGSKDYPVAKLIFSEKLTRVRTEAPGY